MSCSNVSAKTINNDKCRVVVGVKVEESVRSVVGVKMPIYVPSLDDYATKEFVHEKMEQKLDVTKLDEAIYGALAEAKASGEFKGDKGEKGEKGLQGEKGADGRDGRDGANGVNGRDGKDGKDGEKGEDGRTPIKGEDYFTEEDKAEFVKDITPSIKDKVEEIIGDVDLDGNASSIVYDSSMATTHDVTNVKDALDKLLNKVYYSAVSISSFTGGGTYEIGTEILTVSFAWELNKNPLSIAIKQGFNIEDYETIVENLAVGSRSYTYTPKTAIKSNTKFTLKCGDVTDAGVETSRTASTSLSFLYKLFYNTITSNTPSTQSEIQAMGVSGNTTKIHWSNSKTITHAFKGKKFCIALPSSMKISKAVTSNNETITSKFVASSEINYTIGSTTTKYKVHTFEVAAEMDVTLTITLA